MAGTKATTRVGQVRKPRADLEQQLEKYRRELNEALEQQTATSEVLRVISSSPGELKPVFQAMLEHAVRICEAKFGVLYRYDGKLFHPEALIGVPQALVNFHQRGGPFKAVPEPPCHRWWKTKNVVNTADGAVGGRAVAPRSTHAQGRCASREHYYLPPGSPTIHQQADRADHEFRQPGRHRHREHAAAQRAAAAHRRSERVAGAADRDLGGAARHFELTRRAGAGVPCHARERDARLRVKLWHPV